MIPEWKDLKVIRDMYQRHQTTPPGNPQFCQQPARKRVGRASVTARADRDAQQLGSSRLHAGNVSMSLWGLFSTGGGLQLTPEAACDDRFKPHFLNNPNLASALEHRGPRPSFHTP